MKYNLSNIQAMDYIIVTSDSAFAIGERVALSGFKQAFNLGYGTHAAIVVFFEGTYHVVEMMGDGMELNTLDKYFKESPWWFQDRCVSIRRNPVYNDEVIRGVANTRAVNDYYSGKVKYDFAGLIEYIEKDLGMPLFIKDGKVRKYCSELLQAYAIKDGNKISMDHRPIGDDDNITPHDIQVAANLIDIEFKK